MPAIFDRVITVYGRKPVLEALEDTALECYRLHLADSNKASPILDEMLALAQRRGVEQVYHSKKELSRISRKGAQDQGVALDVLCPAFMTLEELLQTPTGKTPKRLLAADGLTNPQNAGMLIRSAVAGGIDGILWPRDGNAALGPLAVKASAGTLFKAPLVRCRKLADALRQCQQHGYRVVVLEANAELSLFDAPTQGDAIYVLGNESSGISAEVADLADSAVSIPMHNDVESLNVAVTAALITYSTAYLER